MDLRIFEMKKPPFKSVLKWKERKDQVDYLIELVRESKWWVENDIEKFDHYQNLDNCTRAINLLHHFKADDVYKEVFEIFYGMIDFASDDLMVACEKYLLEFSTEKFVPFLYEKWENLVKAHDELSLDAFIFLIKAGAKNEIILASAQEYIWGNYSFSLSSDIIRYLQDDVIKAAVESRLKYIAPMVKYLPNDIFLNEYFQQWNDLGEAYIEVVLKEDCKNPDLKMSDDEIFLVNILGDSDPRISKKIINRTDKLLTCPKHRKVIKDNHTKRKALLSDIFMVGLPKSCEEWLGSTTVTEDHKNEFWEFADFVRSIISLNDTGLNEICPSGSDEKSESVVLF